PGVRAQGAGDRGLATIQSKEPIAISIGVWRKPAIQVEVQDAIKQQVHNPLFPWRNVERAALTVKVVLERQGRAKFKALPLQRAMDRIQTAQAMFGEIVESAPVGGAPQGFAPVEQRLGIHADRGFV